jgi:hypothetical protein
MIRAGAIRQLTDLIQPHPPGAPVQVNGGFGEILLAVQIQSHSELHAATECK